jgi:hypothetical protein
MVGNGEKETIGELLLVLQTKVREDPNDHPFFGGRFSLTV